MLKNYVASLPDNKLAWLYYKVDRQFWHWCNVHYAQPSEDTAYQVERWRRICYMCHDELARPNRHRKA